MRLEKNRLANIQIVEKCVDELPMASLLVALAESQAVEAGLITARGRFAATTIRAMARSTIGGLCITTAIGARLLSVDESFGRTFGNVLGLRGSSCQWCLPRRH